MACQAGSSSTPETARRSTCSRTGPQPTGSPGIDRPIPSGSGPRWATPKPTRSACAPRPSSSARSTSLSRSWPSTRSAPCRTALPGRSDDGVFARCAAVVFDVPNRTLWLEPPCDRDLKEDCLRLGAREEGERGAPRSTLGGEVRPTRGIGRFRRREGWRSDPPARREGCHPRHLGLRGRDGAGPRNDGLRRPLARGGGGEGDPSPRSAARTLIPAPIACPPS